MGQHKGVFLIRDMGHNDDRIHSALGRIGEGRHHIVVQDQVRRHNVYISSCLVDDIQIDLVAHRLPVQGAVGKRNGIAVHV